MLVLAKTQPGSDANGKCETRRRFTVDEFNRMAEAGIFAPDERIELVEGVVISYAPPQGPLHAGIVWGFPEVIRAALRDRAVLWSQLPVIISETTELEPDLAILAVREGGYRKALPRVTDVHAVVEIADSSLSRDRTRKLQVYAVAGIAEYWVVAVRDDRVEVYREPRGAEYGSYRLALRGDTVSFAAFPDVELSVDELLG
jgi:Uma2 family endonuclease